MPTHANRKLALLRRGAALTGALMFLGIFGAFLLQVVARYVFSWPLGWPDEAITILFVWVVFWGAATLVPFERHISFDLLQLALPSRHRRWTSVAALSVTAALFVAAIPVTADFIVFSHRQQTPVLELPLSVVYAPVLLFLLASILRIGLQLRRLLGHAASRAGATVTAAAASSRASPASAATTAPPGAGEGPVE